MDGAVQAAAARARNPFKASLEKLTRIPFADHPLTPYFPAFSAAVNGEQTNQYFTTTPKTIAADLGGVQIDGLISHAFLKEYVWTLDFDRMRYVFSKPDK